jgi:hypothetical protein
VAIDRDGGCFVGVHGAPILPLTLFGQGN